MCIRDRVETPVLIKSTPEGARDFVVPSRMNQGEFYALPQSPQIFKQLLMVAGFDRYYQIVKCFRDEDLRADRQPEFTQIDCEMSFVEQEDILNMFEGLVKRIFKDVKNIDYTETVQRITWEEAMWNYGNDKPDIRFDIKICNLKFPAHTFPAKESITGLIAGEFAVFNEALSFLLTKTVVGFFRLQTCKPKRISGLSFPYCHMASSQVMRCTVSV